VGVMPLMFNIYRTCLRPTNQPTELLTFSLPTNQTNQVKRANKEQQFKQVQKHEIE